MRDVANIGGDVVSRSGTVTMAGCAPCASVVELRLRLLWPARPWLLTPGPECCPWSQPRWEEWHSLPSPCLGSSWLALLPVPSRRRQLRPLGGFWQEVAPGLGTSSAAAAWIGSAAAMARTRNSRAAPSKSSARVTITKVNTIAWNECGLADIQRMTTLGQLWLGSYIWPGQR